MNDILRDLLLEVMQCWVYIRDEDVIAVAVTSILKGIAGDKDKLLLYALYSFGELTDEDWVNGFKTLSTYALSRGCEQVAGSTERKGLIKTIQRLGGDVGYSFTIPCVH
jgi:hypothetical protein